MRAMRLLAALSLLVLGACGGGSSPTEPSTPVALEGTWAGTITITSPGPTSTCSVEVTFQQDAQEPAFFFGNWRANCSGAQGGNVTTAFAAFGDSVILTSLGSPQVFSCGWSSVLLRDGRRLSSSDWGTPQNCQPMQRGRIELTKQN
jgi:hypothetical protein